MTEESTRANFGLGDQIMSNPHYDSDLKILESASYDISRILDHRSIIVVTGCHLLAELLDRPVAEILRDEIDRRGHPISTRRAAIMGDMYWYADKALRAYSTISVSGPSMNNLTKEIADLGDESEINGLHVARLEGRYLRLALWGESASETRDSVLRFIDKPHGLDDFLESCWA